jgi:hypothetical protein
MPVMKCVNKDGKSGWKYGDSGTCYTGPDAKKKVEEQAAAIYASGYQEKAQEIVKAYLDSLED